MKNKFILILLLLLLLPVITLAKSNKPKVYLFYGNGCPHCVLEKEFLYKLDKTIKDNVDIYMYEVFDTAENKEFFTKTREKYEISNGYVPLLVIGDKFFIGYDEGQNDEIIAALKNNISDEIGSFLTGKEKGKPLNFYNLYYEYIWIVVSIILLGVLTVYIVLRRKQIQKSN